MFRITLIVQLIARLLLFKENPGHFFKIINFDVKGTGQLSKRSVICFNFQRCFRQGQQCNISSSIIGASISQAEEMISQIPWPVVVLLETSLMILENNVYKYITERNSESPCITYEALCTCNHRILSCLKRGGIWS